MQVTSRSLLCPGRNGQRPEWGGHRRGLDPSGLLLSPPFEMKGSRDSGRLLRESSPMSPWHWRNQQPQQSPSEGLPRPPQGTRRQPPPPPLRAAGRTPEASDDCPMESTSQAWGGGGAWDAGDEARPHPARGPGRRAATCSARPSLARAAPQSASPRQHPCASQRAPGATEGRQERRRGLPRGNGPQAAGTRGVGSGGRPARGRRGAPEAGHGRQRGHAGPGGDSPSRVTGLHRRAVPRAFLGVGRPSVFSSPSPALRSRQRCRKQINPASGRFRRCSGVS